MKGTPMHGTAGAGRPPAGLDASLDALRHARTQRLRTALWLRTEASRSLVERALRALPCAWVEQHHATFMHVVYDVDRWDLDDTPATHAAFLANLHSVLSMFGIAYERSIGPVLAPTPLPLPDTLSVLVVDDQADAAEALAINLRQRGHRVTTANGGLEAIHLATAVHPDVVLLDLAMPDMDGIDACRLMRALVFGGDAVVIAVTGQGRERIIARGFDDHLQKPVQVDEVEARMRRLVARKRRLAGGA